MYRFVRLFDEAHGVVHAIAYVARKRFFPTTVEHRVQYTCGHKLPQDLSHVLLIAVNLRWSLCVKPKFHWLITSRLDTTQHERRVERVELCLFQFGEWQTSSSARVYKFSILCSGFASISVTTSGKSEVDMSTPVHAVATPMNTCRASRACCARRDESVAPCCPTSATRVDTSRHVLPRLSLC